MVLCMLSDQSMRSVLDVCGMFQDQMLNPFVRRWKLSLLERKLILKRECWDVVKWKVFDRFITTLSLLLVGIGCSVKKTVPVLPHVFSSNWGPMYFVFSRLKYLFL